MINKEQTPLNIEGMIKTMLALAAMVNFHSDR